MLRSVVLAGLGSYVQSVVKALEYIAAHWRTFLSLLQTHMTIVLLGVGAAIVVAVPLGILVKIGRASCRERVYTKV